MNKTEVYEFLNSLNIEYEVTEHPAAFSMEELSKIDLPYPEADAKNLFLCDPKKNYYYLITVKGDKRVDIKEFQKTYANRHLSFARENDMIQILGVTPGSVTPLGILNDKDLKVEFYLDIELTKGIGLVGVHPNENTATVWLKTSDLVSIIKNHGNKVTLINV